MHVVVDHQNREVRFLQNSRVTPRLFEEKVAEKSDGKKEQIRAFLDAARSTKEAKEEKPTKKESLKSDRKKRLSQDVLASKLKKMLTEKKAERHLITEPHILPLSLLIEIVKLQNTRWLSEYQIRQISCSANSKSVARDFLG